MNLTRIATFGIIAGGLAALVGAATSGTRHIEEPAPLTTPAIEMSGAQLEAEIGRLHERLRPTIAPQQPARNLFEFGSSRSSRPVEPSAVTPVEAPPVLVPAPPAIKLIGIAEDVDAGGNPVRTAIISGSGQLYVVKEGESVTDRFHVAKISGEAVELSESSGAAPVVLALK